MERRDATNKGNQVFGRQYHEEPSMRMRSER
jgi:hypothetical protein